METEVVKEEVSAKPSKFGRLLDISFLVLLINLIIEIIVTVIAILIRAQDGFLDLLIQIGFIAIVAFVFVIIAPLVIAFIYEAYGTRLRGWDEDKASDRLIYSFFILLGILTFVVSILLYYVTSVMTPILLDPFNLGGIVGMVYSLWWFFGFILSTIILAIITIIILATTN
ncbi:MAG: hypothetical protein ACXAEU_12240 [Candidatus Hodarchaeales archaeon]|jgi:hypothetical protein